MGWNWYSILDITEELYKYIPIDTRLQLYRQPYNMTYLVIVQCLHLIDNTPCDYKHVVLRNLASVPITPSHDRNRHRRAYIYQPRHLFDPISLSHISGQLMLMFSTSNFGVGPMFEALSCQGWASDWPTHQLCAIHMETGSFIGEVSSLGYSEPVITSTTGRANTHTYFAEACVLKRSVRDVGRLNQE